MFFLVTPMFLGSCFIVIAFTAVGRNPSLTEAFPLQGCKNNDIDLLLVTEFNLVYEFYKQRIFLSELLDYFLPPDDVLRRRLKVAMAYSRLSYEAREFSFQFDNITDNDKVPTIAESPSLSFQYYNTTEDVDNQLHLFPRVSGIGLYTNDTFIDNCYKRDLLGWFALNSSHVAAVIVGNITTHAIERFQYANSHWGKACSVKMFLILVGHDVKDIFLQQIPKIETQFILPYLRDILLTDLCFTCYYGRPTNRGLIKEKSYYSMYTSDSPMTWFEASQQCKKRSGQIVSVETEAELHFLTFILNNYYEEMYQEQTSDADATDDIQYFKKLYIGLIRDVSRAGSPFQWLNGSPLVSTQWLNTLPDGGPNQRCGLWLFSSTIEWSKSSDGTAYNVSGLQNHNGWEDIGCGSRVTNIVLCESESFVDLFDYHIENLKALPAKTDSFINAVSQGEFKIYQNEIVSIPAFVRNSTFANFFKKTDILFRVFYCDGEDDDTDIVPYSYVCDYVDHCRSGQDENICYNDCKNSTEFQCQSGQCVPLESRCDVYTDCYDGSDEEDCQFCNSAMCCDGSCLPRHFALNGEVDCVGCSAHEGDENFDANQDLRYCDCPFICNRSECVAPSMLNDNITQCLGPEGPLDEIWGKLETVDSCKISYQFNVSSIEFVRWSPRCVYIKDRYGTVIGCRDMSHLHDCQNFTCPEGYVKCPDSFCIPLHLVGDSLKDCPNGLEERSEIKINCTGNFQCWGEKVCVHPDLVCDGYPHCPSGDDELNCHVSCAEGFRCIGGTVTVTDYDKSKPLHDLSFIDKRTRYLDLSGVDMSAVINVGKEEQLRHVVELYLSNCQISDLNGNTIFKFSLHGVYALDLSYNLISTLSGTMMTSMYNLHVINLSHNKLLTSIPFNMWNELKHLNLAFTAVSTVNQVVLSNFKKLDYLNLSHTHISVIDQQSLPKQLSLATLDLRGTPLSNIEPNALFSLSVSKDFYSDLYKLCCPQVRGQGIYEHVCHAPASAISSCMDLIQEPAQRVLLWTVGVLAVTGNLVVITYRLLWDRTVLKKSYGLFVTNLSVSDLFMGVYLLIIAGTDVIYRDNYVWYESDWRHSTLCQTAGFLSTLSSETSAFFILLVTIDRFLVIRFPFGHFRFTRWSMVLSCLVAWTVGFLFALIPALPRFQHWQMYSSNGMCLGLPLTPDRRSGWEYSAALFIGLNFILFLFIACGQYLIYNAMSENSLKMSSEVQSNDKRVQEIMVAKQLSLVVLSDFLCWFPIGILGLLAMSGRDIGTEVYAWSAVLVLPINSALNPVLYTVPVIMKKWEDFKQGNGKTGTKKSFRSRGSTRETSS